MQTKIIRGKFVLIIITAILGTSTMCILEKDKGGNKDKMQTRMTMAMLGAYAAGKAEGMASHVALNGENEFGNPMGARTMDQAPVWPGLDYGFFDQTVLQTGGASSAAITTRTDACAFGGTRTISGSQTINVTVNGDGSRTVDVSSGSRTVKFDNCQAHGRMTITSGTITLTQVGSATLTIDNVSTTPGTVSLHTIQNLVMDASGSLQINRTTPRGTRAETSTITLRISTSSRVFQWTVDSSGSPADPQLISRSGMVQGTVVIGDSTKDVSLTF